TLLTTARCECAFETGMPAAARPAINCFSRSRRWVGSTRQLHHSFACFAADCPSPRELFLRTPENPQVPAKIRRGPVLRTDDLAHWFVSGARLGDFSRFQVRQVETFVYQLE